MGKRNKPCAWGSDPRYEISGLLGAGGMGEVYRARDRKPQCDVAIKILPPAFAGDPDRLARFEREAQVLASSNFFFPSRRRHARCSRDWSSDVCSSDLILAQHVEEASHAGDLDLDRLTVDHELEAHRGSWGSVGARKGISSPPRGRSSIGGVRSEERRVGQGCILRWTAEDAHRNQQPIS